MSSAGGPKDGGPSGLSSSSGKPPSSGTGRPSVKIRLPSDGESEAKRGHESSRSRASDSARIKFASVGGDGNDLIPLVDYFPLWQSVELFVGEYRKDCDLSRQCAFAANEIYATCIWHVENASCMRSYSGALIPMA